MSGQTLRSNLESDYEPAFTRADILAFRTTSMSPPPPQRRLCADIERAWHWLETGGHVVHRVELAGLNNARLTRIYKHEARRVRALSQEWKAWW